MVVACGWMVEMARGWMIVAARVEYNQSIDTCLLAYISLRAQIQ